MLLSSLRGRSRLWCAQVQRKTGLFSDVFWLCSRQTRLRFVMEEFNRSRCEEHVGKIVVECILFGGSLLGFLDSPTFLGVTVGALLGLLVTVVVAIVLERAITRRLRGFSRRRKLEPGVANSLILTFRLIVLIGVVVVLVRIGGLPTEWFVAFSALGGAAVGFASTKTIGNFIAGLYLFAARPFSVGDLVRLGTVEGIVQEMTINYTRVLTVGKNVVSISNLMILDRDITNFMFYTEERERLYCYTFEVAFDHSVSAGKIGQVFGQVFDRYRDTLPRDPDFMLVRSGAFERVYMVYLYVADAEEVFKLRPRIVEEVFSLWDSERAARS